MTGDFVTQSVKSASSQCTQSPLDFRPSRFWENAPMIPDGAPCAILKVVKL